VIDPVQGLNADVPYSPKQTCGAEGCHDYALITQGFHFTQGQGETPPAAMTERYAWVSHPGNYGGNWCSPAPLYRALAPKKNTSAREIDMSSFAFITAGCGNCHPGGGPLEFDRDGHRYDTYMQQQGMVAGAENGLDGDYFEARWSETGVIEADCLLCHMPEYSLKTRNAELAKLNFRWAASAASGFAKLSGSVKDGVAPSVVYDLSKFDEQGNIKLHLVPEPRNETCLGCHFKSDWKKRGSAYSQRTDVHMVAGLRCVDCHSAGSDAPDERIRGRERHQIAKGDDPSGWIRNDLDDTVRSCEDCHLSAWRNAPRAEHAWLPPLHLDTLSCQACHIPTRAVKSALVQASDVYNPAPRIKPPGKHIWTFYDQSMAFWNHYGELELFTGADVPTTLSRPTLIRYKGKIYPANRVHSAWVGYEIDGQSALGQLQMKDFYTMWSQHRAEPSKNYPSLSIISDDNRDAIIEVNQPSEIDALLEACSQYLADTKFPMQGRRLVWVSGTRAYRSSTDYRELDAEEYESGPYASVYKFSHDVAPAKAALGAGGCTDCHSMDSAFFQGAVLELPFHPSDGEPRWMANHQILGISAFWVQLGALRESVIKPLVLALGALLALLFAGYGASHLARRQLSRARSAQLGLLVSVVAVAVLASLVAQPDWLSYLTLRRFTLDANHAWVSLFCLGAASSALLLPPSWRRWTRLLELGLLGSLGLAALSGMFMLLKFGFLETLTRLSYSSFEFALAASLMLASLLVLGCLSQCMMRNEESEQPKAETADECRAKGVG
jgi:hypothetical protein